ncbi:MAG: hypothetical protein HZA78_05990 [Candidatus Schekmanbacteria bacterium]|nr:hypothetical protein [Candidatus Schekmanbacteria bacterium]
MLKKPLGSLFGFYFLMLTGLGCSSINAGQYSSKLNSDIKSDLKADIEVGEKISGSASMKRLFGFIVISAPEKYAVGVTYNSDPGREYYFSTHLFPENPSLCIPSCIFSDACFSSCVFPNIFSSELVTAAAAHDAISKSGADILVAPRYEIEYINHILVSEVRATVVGYKGKIKGIKTIKTRKIALEEETEGE